MARWQWLTAGAVAAAAGAATASSIVLLAQRFVNELSRPGVSLDEATMGGWVVPQAVDEPPIECRRQLEFVASDGTDLRGEFWAQPQPAATIVICHGYRASREHLRPVAALEHANGCNVLLFDFRGHGESAQIATSGGNAEVRDLTAALDIASQQPETLRQRLYIHGFSMGAAVALLLSPRADIAGIIADSPYARLDDILSHLVTWQLTTESAGWPKPLQRLRAGFPALGRVTFFASDLLFRLRFHHPLRARPERQVRRYGVRPRGRHRETMLAARHRPPLLLIHSLRDPFIQVDHAFRIARAALAGHVPVELHFADSDIHCGAYGRDPEQYVSLVRRFIAQA
ncbi:MAG TPA: alpha/beta fold hydrolase [Ktedonobacterales bacterium]|nr:alpha/beta fold hydrolase [Ktedonobacterales bacterium]